MSCRDHLLSRQQPPPAFSFLPLLFTSLRKNSSPKTKANPPRMITEVVVEGAAGGEGGGAVGSEDGRAVGGPGDAEGLRGSAAGGAGRAEGSAANAGRVGDGVVGGTESAGSAGSVGGGAAEGMGRT